MRRLLPVLLLAAVTACAGSSAKPVQQVLTLQAYVTPPLQAAMSVEITSYEQAHKVVKVALHVESAAQIAASVKAGTTVDLVATTDEASVTRLGTALDGTPTIVKAKGYHTLAIGSLTGDTADSFVAFVLSADGQTIRRANGVA